MESVYFFSTLVVAAMFLGAAGSATGSLSLQVLESLCRGNTTALFPHPLHCQLYYNCSNSGAPFHRHFDTYLEECRYPQLFSALTSQCMPFDDVTCGERLEHVDQCDYLRSQCGSAHCIPCSVWAPSCEGLPEGRNVYRGREWSPNFALCRSNRTVDTAVCPVHQQLGSVQVFHPDKRSCVSLYEVPRQHRGLLPDCSQKADGFHSDDVTFRPDVYFRCHGGQLADGGVHRCEGGRVFSQQVSACVYLPGNS